jgi:phosphoribosylanthranilate isomerase
MTRIKICGVTNAADALAASQAGADAVGLNFYSGSRRVISSSRAAEIRDQLSSSVQVFGVFVNADPAEVATIAKEVRLDALQLHGDEDPTVVAKLAKIAPVFKALRVGADFSPAALEKYPAATGFLFDAPDSSDGQYGGTGRLADWEVAQQAARSHKIILAGGLNAENVAAAIVQVHPYGIDVASGIESAPGAKDHQQLRAFIREARRADQQINTPAEKVRAL